MPFRCPFGAQYNPSTRFIGLVTKGWVGSYGIYTDAVPFFLGGDSLWEISIQIHGSRLGVLTGVPGMDESWWNPAEVSATSGEMGF